MLDVVRAGRTYEVWVEENIGILNPLSPPLDVELQRDRLSAAGRGYPQKKAESQRALQILDRPM